MACGIPFLFPLDVLKCNGKSYALGGFMTKLSLTAFILSFTAFSARATTLLPLNFWGPESSQTRFQEFLSTLTYSKDYQIGDEWGKKAVSAEGLSHETKAFQRAAKATARMGGATAFYLGEYAGHYVVATNHHVLPEASACLGGYARFPLLGKSYKCVRFYGEWTDVDLALFEIEVTRAEDRDELRSLGMGFAFDAHLTQGRELLTIGFGIADNASRVMMANQDSDCKVFSRDGDFHFMGDPDEFNPGPYKAWSFANGCDVSHGDSGSAMVDRKTSEVLGLIWTGKIPKNPKVQSSAYLNQLVQDQSPEIWTELSFAVPAPKIRDVLQTVVSAPSTADDIREVLSAMLH
jgi:hypothetical protein